MVGKGNVMKDTRQGVCDTTYNVLFMYDDIIKQTFERLLSKYKTYTYHECVEDLVQEILSNIQPKLLTYMKYFVKVNIDKIIDNNIDNRLIPMLIAELSLDITYFLKKIT